MVLLTGGAAASPHGTLSSKPQAPRWTAAAAFAVEPQVLVPAWAVIGAALPAVPLTAVIGVVRQTPFQIHRAACLPVRSGMLAGQKQPRKCPMQPRVTHL